MDKNDVEQISNKNKQKKENEWKEILFSKERHKKINSDERSLLVFKALRAKLGTENRIQEKPEIEIQLEKSELHLQELIKFGNELVNNIKSSHESHELLRSQNKHEKDIELQENMRKEAELSLSQFEEINKKWQEMNTLKEPMAIHEDMQRQRENIENLMASKNELIEQCEHELKKINQKYYEDQDKQSEEICVLVDRVDHQIMLLKKSYRASINDLQNTIELERQRILESSQEKWNIVYDHLMETEAKNIEMVKDKQRFYAQELDNIRNNQEEITRTTKIRLEKDAEVLELEIRKTQANILMNSEKIGYNYQVLQKRNEENIIINNQQKRRVAKLNESIVTLKKKLDEIKCDNKLAMQKLTLDIQKLHSSINDLQTKSEHFRKNNSIKLAKVWDINFKEIKHLMTRVFEIDRILYEQQLGRKWLQPNIDLDGLDYIKDFQIFPKTKTILPQHHKQLKKITSQRYLHDILFKISDRAGFLIEDRLLEILSPYTDEEKCLVKIENIFSALNLTDIKEVEGLMKYFEPYSWCPNCSSKLAINSLNSFGSDKNVEEGKTNYQNKTNSFTEIFCNNHELCMEPAFVLCALNNFMSKEVNKFGKSAEGKRKTDTKLELDLLQLQKSDVSSYWQQFSSYMPKEQQNIWKSIEHGLNHYLEVLKKRSQLDGECVFLQKQNAELKHLLQKL